MPSFSTLIVKVLPSQDLVSKIRCFTLYSGQVTLTSSDSAWYEVSVLVLQTDTALSK